MLFERRGSRLYARGTDGWLKIIYSDGFYPETIIVEAANQVFLQAKQLSPSLYGPLEKLEGPCIFHEPYKTRQALIDAQAPNAGGERRLQCALCHLWIRDYELLKEELQEGLLKHCPLKLAPDNVEASEVSNED